MNKWRFINFGEKLGINNGVRMVIGKWHTWQSQSRDSEQRQSKLAWTTNKVAKVKDLNPVV